MSCRTRWGAFDRSTRHSAGPAGPRSGCAALPGAALPRAVGRSIPPKGETGHQNGTKNKSTPRSHVDVTGMCLSMIMTASQQMRLLQSRTRNRQLFVPGLTVTSTMPRVSVNESFVRSASCANSARKLMYWLISEVASVLLSVLRRGCIGVASGLLRDCFGIASGLFRNCVGAQYDFFGMRAEEWHYVLSVKLLLLVSTK